MYACMHACMQSCMYVCMHACMYVCMHACNHVCMYACMHVCLYVYIYIHIININHPLTHAILIFDAGPWKFSAWRCSKVLGAVAARGHVQISWGSHGKFSNFSGEYLHDIGKNVMIMGYSWIKYGD